MSWYFICCFCLMISCSLFFPVRVSLWGTFFSVSFHASEFSWFLVLMRYACSYVIVRHLICGCVVTCFFQENLMMPSLNWYAFLLSCTVFPSLIASDSRNPHFWVILFFKGEKTFSCYSLRIKEKSTSLHILMIKNPKCHDN